MSKEIPGLEFKVVECENETFAGIETVKTHDLLQHENQFPFNMIVELKFSDPVIGPYGNYSTTVGQLFRWFKTEMSKS